MVRLHRLLTAGALVVALMGHSAAIEANRAVYANLVQSANPGTMARYNKRVEVAGQSCSATCGGQTYNVTCSGNDERCDCACTRQPVCE